MNLKNEEQANWTTLGFFDSGVGGLSVLKEIAKLADSCSSSKYRFIYIGDTARCPYGNREKHEIVGFVAQLISWLSRQDVDQIIMACNTSAALAYEYAKKISPVPVHDLIQLAAQYIATRYKKIGVLATASTVKSRAFSYAIQEANPQVSVLELACPELVPLIEAGQIYDPHTKVTLSRYTKQLEAAGIEAVIMGCTHFPFLKHLFYELLPQSVRIVDPANLLAAHFFPDSNEESFLGYQNLLPKTRFFVTGDLESFSQTADVCLGLPSGSLIKSDTVFSINNTSLAAAAAENIRLKHQALETTGISLVS